MIAELETHWTQVVARAGVDVERLFTDRVGARAAAQRGRAGHFRRAVWARAGRRIASSRLRRTRAMSTGPPDDRRTQTGCRPLRASPPQPGSRATTRAESLKTRRPADWRVHESWSADIMPGVPEAGMKFATIFATPGRCPSRLSRYRTGPRPGGPYPSTHRASAPARRRRAWPRDGVEPCAAARPREHDVGRLVFTAVPFLGAGGFSRSPRSEPGTGRTRARRGGSAGSAGWVAARRSGRAASDPSHGRAAGWAGAPWSAADWCAGR